MKVEMTEGQLEAIKSLTDDVSAMLGTAGADDAQWECYVRSVDRFLKKNNLPPRNYK